MSGSDACLGGKAHEWGQIMSQFGCGRRQETLMWSRTSAELVKAPERVSGS